MLTIPKSSTRTTGNGENSALEQSDPNRSFGNKSIAVQNRLQVPDLAGIEYKGDIAMANAIGSVASDVMSVALDVKKRKEVVKSGTERNRANYESKKYRADRQQTVTDVEQEGHANDWSASKIESEIESRLKIQNQQYKANTSFDDEVLQSDFNTSLDGIDEDSRADLDKKSMRRFITENNELASRSNELNIKNLSVTSNTEDVAAAFAEQANIIDQRAATDMTMSDEMVAAEKSKTLNAYLLTTLEGQRERGELATADEMIESLNTFIESKPELADMIDTAALVKEMKKINRSAEIEDTRIANKKDAQFDGAFNLMLAQAESVKDIPTEDNILSQDISDKEKAKAITNRNKFIKEFEKDISDASAVNNKVSSTKGYYFGRNGEKDKELVEGQYQQKLTELSDMFDSNPAAANAALVDNAVNVGRVADSFKGKINSLINDEDPDRVKLGVTLFKAIEGQDSKLIRQDFKNNQPEVMIADLVSKGTPPDLAKTEVSNYFSMPKEIRTNLEKNVADVDTKQLLSDGLTQRGLGMNTVFDEKIPDLMASEFEEEYKRLSVAYKGDSELAASRATENVLHGWGKTSVDGSPRFMKSSPEQVYGQGQDSSWMGEQLARDVTEMNVDPNNVRLVVSPKTRNSATPEYWIFDKSQGDYVRGENGLTLPWIPDKTENDAYRKEEKRLAREAEIGKPKPKSLTIDKGPLDYFFGE